MLFGRDNIPAKIKYQGDVIIHRTPIIVLTNYDIVSREEAFQSRVITYKWKHAPFLKECLKMCPGKLSGSSVSSRSCWIGLRR